MTEPSSPPDLLRGFLADRSVQCPACGYELQGVSTDACPECGLRLELTLRGDNFTHRLMPLVLFAFVLSGSLYFYGAWQQLVYVATVPNGAGGGVHWLTYFYAGSEVFFGVAFFTAAHWTWTSRRDSSPRRWLNPFVILAVLHVMRGLMWVVFEVGDSLVP